MIIRETDPHELPRLLALYPVIFPDEDLRPVVSGLIEGEADILSLAAYEAEEQVAHLLFTMCSTGENRTKGALLGPLGVLPDHQEKGVGTKLVRSGLERLEALGIAQVFVLGDPGYYGRFGFRTEIAVRTPCPIPAEWRPAWQSMTIAGRVPLAPGEMLLPEPWLDPALWG